MQIAQVLAGYTLGGADLRRAMGKKNPRRWPNSAACSRRVPRRRALTPMLAIKIFDLVEKLRVTVSTSRTRRLMHWSRIANRVAENPSPAEFMAAVMSSEIDNTDKLLTFRDEARRLGLDGAGAVDSERPVRLLCR